MIIRHLRVSDTQKHDFANDYILVLTTSMDGDKFFNLNATLNILKSFSAGLQPAET